MKMRVAASKAKPWLHLEFLPWYISSDIAQFDQTFDALRRFGFNELLTINN